MNWPARAGHFQIHCPFPFCFATHFEDSSVVERGACFKNFLLVPGGFCHVVWQGFSVSCNHIHGHAVSRRSAFLLLFNLPSSLAFMLFLLRSPSCGTSLSTPIHPSDFATTAAFLELERTVEHSDKTVDQDLRAGAFLRCIAACRSR